MSRVSLQNLMQRMSGLRCRNRTFEVCERIAAMYDTEEDASRYLEMVTE